jgi:hypothetical protein
VSFTPGGGTALSTATGGNGRFSVVVDIEWNPDQATGGSSYVKFQPSLNIFFLHEQLIAQRLDSRRYKEELPNVT